MKWIKPYLAPLCLNDNILLHSYEMLSRTVSCSDCKQYFPNTKHCREDVIRDSAHRAQYRHKWWKFWVKNPNVTTQ